MTTLFPQLARRGSALRQWLRRIRPTLIFFGLVAIAPAFVLAQSGSPFDTGFTALQTLFTGTVAKVASLIVVGGYEFAHGEPGAKKTLAGVAAGTGIAVLATNILAWLWGI
jgi:hypothetical protein